jgi:tetratricopeptide (TPR) repeat protein
MPAAWAALARLRKMTPADHGWLKGAEETAASGLSPLEEADIRYAVGKYYDDLGDFTRAFRSYQRANELQKTAAEPYDREGWTRFVDDLTDVYTRETLDTPHRGASDSVRPVLVCGMPRSGTSLIEQIISSHPHAKGAGELHFWGRAVQKHQTAIRREIPDEALTRKLAAGYVRILEGHFHDATRVVDKTTFNADLLGPIHAVFPHARMIYVRRHAIDTCLSCYFHQLPPTLGFCMDLTDLAHYYRQHHRLIEHWRSELPAGALLDVPYAELVADQEGWTRKILDFLGLEWDSRCLAFHKTQRPVVTASYWQVRQKIYTSSLGRWRHYEKFVGPLRELEGMG